MLQKLRKLPHLLSFESADVFAVPVLLSVLMRFTLAELSRLPGLVNTFWGLIGVFAATTVVALGTVVRVPALPLFRMAWEAIGNCSTEPVTEDAPLGLIDVWGISQPVISTASLWSFSFSTMLSLLGFFLAFLRRDPTLLDDILPDAVNVGGDWER